ncbi:MAG: hypothetical protein HFJ30_04910 [Clostridia bacterium]|nr:hypothetical protein [Clostridia bacterium]MCI9412934.1 hypothetical protein [Clostridia bacterium]
MKKGIIILTILMILVAITLVILLVQKNNIENKRQDGNSIISEIENPSEPEKLNQLKAVLARSEFLAVENCVKTFYQNYTSFNQLGEQPEQVYNLLDSEYIQEFGITKEGLKGKFGNAQSIEIDITKMYGMLVANNQNIYFVYGYLRDKTSSQIADLAIEVRVDNSSKTFSIFPYEYLQKKNYLDITENSKVDIAKTEKIENKTYNKCQDKTQNEEAYVTKLFGNYINRALYHNEFAYQCLDEDYSQKRFGNLQSYKNFIEKNRELYLSYDMQNAKKPEEFSSMQEYLFYLDTYQEVKLKSYQVSQKNDVTQYVCMDSQNNYYIFQESAPMQYKVILDTYTIDLPEFTEKYDKATDEEKVLFNIQKFFEAINQQDYQYAYNKLDATYKSNNFKTIAEFEAYAKKHFFSKNKLAAENPQKQGSLYLYDIAISDATGKDKTTKKKSFVMQLKEGTDFVMSFGI